MSIYQFENHSPIISADAWIAPDVQIIGQAQIDALASIWFGTVIRADNDHIHIGEGSNIQDGCILHNDISRPLIVEPYVTVAHQVMLHDCYIGSNTLIGMQSALLSRSRIGKNSMVGAGSLVTERKVFPDGVLIMGSPARVIRELTDEEIQYIKTVTKNYIEKSKRYAQSLIKKHV